MNNPHHLRKHLNTIIERPINKLNSIEKKLAYINTQDMKIAKALHSEVIAFPLNDDKFHYQLIINCYSYALGLWKFRSFLKAVQDYVDYQNPVTSDLMSQFIHDMNLEEILSGKNNCLILYYTNNEIKHAGIIKDKTTVISKWDKFSIFKHGIWQVPQKYGNEVKFYRLPSREIIKTYFLNYLKHS